MLQALARELQEEIGIRVTQSRPWVTYVHVYPHTTVRLAFCHVTGWEGEPRGLENQRLEWVDPARAAEVGDLLPATLPPLRWLQLPTRYGISSIGSRGLPAFLGRLDAALARGVKLVQLREPQWPDGPGAASLHEALLQVKQRCHAAGARLLVNSFHPAAWWKEADGVHLRAADAAHLDARPALPEGALVGASAHDNAQVTHARDLGADSPCWVRCWTRPAIPARRRWVGKASWPATATPACRCMRSAASPSKPCRRRCAMARTGSREYTDSSEAVRDVRARARRPRPAAPLGRPQ